MRASERGNFIKLPFNNIKGYEQARSCSAFVITPFSYNTAAKLAIVWAITNQKKGYPFEVEIPAGLKINGVILSD